MNIGNSHPTLVFEKKLAVNKYLIDKSHFHLDHCGGLPWFLQKTKFTGRVFMTHATKEGFQSDAVFVIGQSESVGINLKTELEGNLQVVAIRLYKSINHCH